MNEEKCIVCSKRNWKVLRRISNRNVVICRNCTLTKLDPIPKPEELEAFYADEYRKTHSISESVETRILDIEKRRADSIIPHLKEYESRIENHLDIGCSTGTLLKEVKRNLTSVSKQSAIELNDKYRNYVEINNLVNDENGVYSNPIENCDRLKHNSYDLCTIVHVLEHTMNPKSTLEHINSILKDGGVLYIEVPNLKTPYSKLIDGYFILYHLFYFSDKTLEHLLNITGFTVVKKIVQHNTSIAFVCKKKKKEPIPDFDKCEDVERKLNMYELTYSIKQILVKLGARRIKSFFTK